MTMNERVEAEGVELAVRIDGQENLPILILSNSLGANMAMWDEQIPTLSECFRIVRYDTRGHGASSVPDGPYSFNDFTSDVIHLMDYLDINRAHFMGVSLGGMTAIGLGLAHPDRFQKLVVADARSDAPDGFKAMWDERISRIDEGGIEAIIDGTVDSWISPQTRAARPDIEHSVRTMVRETDASGYIATCLGLKQLDYFKHLPQLSLPTLFIGGSDDKGAAPEVMQAMADAAPHSEYITLAGARHLANLDMPDAFNKAVLRFLNS